jgi:hypothetical protein
LLNRQDSAEAHLKLGIAYAALTWNKVRHEFLWFFSSAGILRENEWCSYSSYGVFLGVIDGVWSFLYLLLILDQAL